jgi:uracil phosphoribosyltransferase
MRADPTGNPRRLDTPLTRQASRAPPRDAAAIAGATRSRAANAVARFVYSYRVPVHLVQHPLAHDVLCRLRDVHTTPELFRRLATRISLLMIAEATRDVPTAPVTVQTPLAPAEGRCLAADVVVVPVLRAGMGMLDAVLELLPHARVGHIGLQRDEATAVASQYYAKLPGDLSRSFVLMIDPMLATGGSAVAALDLLRRAGARQVRIVCLVAAPEGIAAVERRHPDVEIFTPVVDRALDERKFIVPGLGDFGDRLYGTQ